MSFSGWLDPKVLVAIYAAILSTINLCMNLLAQNSTFTQQQSEFDRSQNAKSKKPLCCRRNA